MNAYRWEDLREGMSAGFEVELTADMLDGFRQLSGDTNPLHEDLAFAREAGFTGTVAFGLLTASFYSRLVGVHLPGKFALFQGLDVDFVAPAFAGDRLTVSGEIVHRTEAVRRLDLKARITNGAGGLVSRAKLRVGLREH
jgi:3-hydroxybutyryl-CoA dehydratase